MSLSHAGRWFASRGALYAGARWINILKRYRLAPDHAIARIDACVDALLREECRPTFPVPGLILERNPGFFQALQRKGCELAVHGYQHRDLGIIPAAEAHAQLQRAIRSFVRYGIEVHGFRCPYLGCTGEMLDCIPEGLFEYSSNSAILRRVALLEGDGEGNLIVDTLHSLYKADPSPEAAALPWFRANLVEVPVCLPDDLMLIDGYRYDGSKIEEAWSRVLDQAYQRGELFNLIFHPELADLCVSAFTGIIKRAKRMFPPVWIARLAEISAWWREKDGFRLDVTPVPSGFRLSFDCTPRATILARGIARDASTSLWGGGYVRVMARTLDVPSSPRPFVGVSSDIPFNTVRFLRNQGYIVDDGETARDCGTYLDIDILTSYPSEMKLLDYIEGRNVPLIRFGRWPDGARSAMSVTGDLDALSLGDYLTRLYIS